MRVVSDVGSDVVLIVSVVEPLLMNDIVLQIVEGQQWLLGEINVLNSGVSSEINGDNGIHLVWKVGFNVQFKLQ